jgi:hypothetical protein
MAAIGVDILQYSLQEVDGAPVQEEHHPKVEVLAPHLHTKVDSLATGEFDVQPKPIELVGGNNLLASVVLSAAASVRICGCAAKAPLPRSRE